VVGLITTQARAPTTAQQALKGAIDVHIHIHHHWDGSIQADLANVLRKLDQLLEKDVLIMQGEDDLKAALA
jgi:hypothetical protein